MRRVCGSQRVFTIMSEAGWVFSIECTGLGQVYFQTQKEKGHDATNLNVTVVGRDSKGEGQPFVIKLIQKWVASFMKKQGRSTTEEEVKRWIKVVRFVFLGELGDAEDRFDDVVVEAEYKDEDINMAIKQRFQAENTEVFTILGELQISRRGSHEVTLEDILANSCVLLSQANRHYREADRQNRVLNQRMDEFIRKKKESDDEMLQRFSLLLNAKKQKINELLGKASMRQELKDDDNHEQHSNEAEDNNNDAMAESDDNEARSSDSDDTKPTANERQEEEPNPAAGSSEAETTDDED